MAGIGFFAPLPLAMMLPFMAGQSMIMGDAFGKAYQYGKRKISAMSNEEFNKMDANTLGRELLEDYTLIVPHLKQAVHQSREFQSLIIRELVEIVKSLPADLIAGATGSAGNQSPEADILGGIAKLFPNIPEAFGSDTPDTQPPPPTLDTSFRFPKNAGTFAGRTNKEAWAVLDTMKRSDIAILGDNTPNSDLKQLVLSWFRLNPKPESTAKTPEQAIADTTVKGSMVQIIASAFAKMKFHLDAAFAYASKADSANVRRKGLQLQSFIKIAKAFNVMVASTRNPATGNTYVNLQVDTAKSIKAFRIIPKT